jgi:hypothetical protein
MIRWSIGTGGGEGIAGINCSVLATRKNLAGDPKGYFASNSCNSRDVFCLAKDKAARLKS